MILYLLFNFISLGLSIYFSYWIASIYGWYYLLLILPMTVVGFILLWGLWAIFVVAWSQFLDKKKPIGPVNYGYYWIMQQTDWLVLHTANIFWKVYGKENLPKKTNYLLINNHISDFDQMVLLANHTYPPLVCVTKPENLDFPIGGHYIHHAGFIPINRENPVEGAKAIRKAANVILEKKGNVCISPEGTRNKTEELLLPFHPGSFKIAVWAKCPIVITCVKGTKAISGRAPWRRSKVEIHYLKTLYYEDYKDMKTPEIAELAESLIKEELLKK